MSLSVVSVAMHLSGLDAQHFMNGDQKVRWLYEDGARKLHSASPALSIASTNSTTSSSGFNSWGSDSHNGKEDVTVVNNNANVAPEAPSPAVERQAQEKVMFNGRNILDLSNNLKDSKWDNFQYTELKKNPIYFFDNRSQFSRVNGDPVPLHVDVECSLCGFVQPIFD